MTKIKIAELFVDLDAEPEEVAGRVLFATEMFTIDPMELALAVHECIEQLSEAHAKIDVVATEMFGRIFEKHLAGEEAKEALAQIIKPASGD